MEKGLTTFAAEVDPDRIARSFEAVTGKSLADEIRLALERRLDLIEWRGQEPYHMRSEFGVSSYADMMRRHYDDAEVDRWNGRYGLDADDWLIGYVYVSGTAVDGRAYSKAIRSRLRADFAGHVRRQVAAFAAGIKAQPDTVPVAVSTAIVKAREYVATLDITADERDEFSDMADAARTMADAERIREMVRRWRTEVAA